MALLVLLFLIMFTLKLAGVIGLSWLIVTSPLWGPLVASFAIMVVGFVCVLFGFKFARHSPGHFLARA